MYGEQMTEAARNQGKIDLLLPGCRGEEGRYRGASRCKTKRQRKDSLMRAKDRLSVGTENE